MSAEESARVSSRLGPHFRMYCDVYTSPKLRKLEDRVQLRFVWLLALHRQGKLVGRPISDAAWIFRVPEAELAEDIEALKSARLLHDDMEPVGWRKRQAESDLSTPRVQKMRAAKAPEVPEGGPAFNVAKALAISIKTWKPNYAGILPDRIENTLQSWARDIDLAIRKDLRDPSRLVALTKWLPSHDGAGGFRWRDQVLSGRKLREQFDKLEIAESKGHPGGNASIPIKPPKKDTSRLRPGHPDFPKVYGDLTPDQKCWLGAWENEQLAKKKSEAEAAERKARIYGGNIQNETIRVDA